MKRILAVTVLGLTLADCAYYGPGYGYAGPAYSRYGGRAPATERALPNGAFGG